MDLNFDYRTFQKESMEKLAKIYAESLAENSDEDNNVEVDETFNKIQKLLDCKEMEKCHPFLFTLDRVNVNEDDKKKIDELYECGLKRGVISEEETKEEQANECDDSCVSDDSLCGGPADALTDRPLTQPDLPTPETRPTFNVLYSAMKDGDIKMGEFYSSAADNNGAKEDCISQLTQAGYNGITIMAVEQNTSAVDTNVEEEPSGVNLYGMYEDDSKEYEEQETGSESVKDEEPANTPAPEEKKEEEKKPEEDKKEEKPEDKQEEKPEETPEEKKEDKKEEDKSTEDKEDDKEESSEETKDNEEEEKKELSGAEKTALKDEYTKLFKQVLQKTKLEKSVADMSLTERTDFWNKIAEKWTKNDPAEFLSDKDQEKLNKLVVKNEEVK